MKLVTYLKEGHDHLAMCIDGILYDMDSIHPELPTSMAMFLNYWDDYFPVAQNAAQRIISGLKSNVYTMPMEEAAVLGPVPYPTSLRDAYSFRQHITTLRHNNNLQMIPEFEQFPVFYFSNHSSIQGPGDIVCMPDHLDKLDFELEAAIVICKAGRNITAAEADGYIGGLMIMNDISARTLQLEEMRLSLGPAKGKDFATITGPMLVTLDELESYEVACPENHTGKAWNLAMSCAVNGVPVSRGNLKDMTWTFAEIIERCSYGTQLFAGDIIGSGTVGTGCFLELNGTAKLNDNNYLEQWLKEGDVVEMEIEGLGKLTNTIVKEENDFSILKLKK